MAQSNEQSQHAPQNEIVEEVRVTGGVLLIFLAFLASIAMLTVAFIDHALWAHMLALVVITWLVALAFSLILYSLKKLKK